MSDYYEPTSHEYLYEMDRENLFALFVGAVESLKWTTTAATAYG
jgi:hypothetical protein